jgi:hypothetical protein
MGIGGTLSVLALVALVWFLMFQQTSVTTELLFLPIFGLAWGYNTFLDYFLRQGNRRARICLGVEGVLLLVYYYFRQGFAPPQVPDWVSMTILRLGWLLVGPMPYVLRWVFIALGLVSICALLWPRKVSTDIPC